MTGLRKWRRMAKGLIIFSFVWEAAIAIVSLVLLGLVAAQGGAASSERLISAVGILGLGGVVIWASWDARRRGRRRHPDRVATAEEEV